MTNVNVIRKTINNQVLFFFRILHVNTLDRDFGPGPSLNEVLKWWKLEILYGLKTL